MERQFVDDAFESNWLSTVGPNLTALETTFSELVGLPSVALSNGTAAIHLGLKLLGVGPGDEVVTPTLSFTASANPIRYEQAVPVFIDSERDTWNLDPNLLAEFLKKRARVNKLPKAVSVVHLFGQPAQIEPMIEICRPYAIPVLEDAANALGARSDGRHVGTFADVGVFSFGGNKIITSTAGGMLVSPNKEWVEKARFWSTQARDPDPDGVNNYVHSELGYNYRLSNVLAGIARGQLEVLELRVRQRRAVFERYCAAFADLPGIEPQRDGAKVQSNVESRGSRVECLEMGSAPASGAVFDAPVEHVWSGEQESIREARIDTGEASRSAGLPGPEAPHPGPLPNAEREGGREAVDGRRSRVEGGVEQATSLSPLATCQRLGADRQVAGPDSQAGCSTGGQSSDLGPRTSDFGSRTSRHTRWLSCFLIDEREFGMSSADLIRFLEAANVEARPVWKPMHTQPLYRGYECIGGSVAEDLNRRGICLPSSSSLTEDEQRFVIERVREAARRGTGG